MMMSQKASQLTNQELRFKISKNTKQVHAVLAVTLRTSEGEYIGVWQPMKLKLVVFWELRECRNRLRIDMNPDTSENASFSLGFWSSVHTVTAVLSGENGAFGKRSSMWINLKIPFHVVLSGLRYS